MMKRKIVMTPLNEYLQKAAGQLACARDSAKNLIPCPLEMVTRLGSMVKECERLMEEESEHYKRYNRGAK